MNPASTPAADLDPISDLVRRILEAAGPKVVLSVAGGGTEVFPWLLGRGGGSALLLAGRIPYDPADFHALLGVDPGRLVDARAARGLAMAAFRYALQLRPDLGGDGVVGLGATSKLALGGTERAGRDHEIHLALQSQTATVVESIHLPTGTNRVWQERINGLAILNLLARANQLPGLELTAQGQHLPTDSLRRQEATAAQCGWLGVPAVLTGRVPWVARYRDTAGVIDARSSSSPPPTRLILPGSFRPLHAGHLRMATLAEEIIGVPCAFELSLFHPAKPPLDYLSIVDRVERFAGVVGWLYLTDAPTYLAKARLFPGSTFVVGHDTALRIIEPRWYGGSLAARDAMLDELEALGIRFLVFGRVDATGRFRDLDAETFDHPRVSSFVARSTQVVGEAQFRADVSSTDLRTQAAEELP